MKLPFPILSIVVVLVVIGAAVFFLAGGEDDSLATSDEMTVPSQGEMDSEPEPTGPDIAKPEKPAPVAEEPPAPEPDPRLVPPPEKLENSDPKVAKALEILSPKLGQWLIPDEQVRKWVLAVDMVAEGKLPKRYRPINYPMPKFAVEQEGDEIVADEDNYARMDALLDALETIDIELLADYYHDWKPLLEEAYSEQGKAGTFEQQLNLALSQVLSVSPRSEKADLVHPSVLYRYENKELEAASDIEKLLWRMGEDNALRLQDFARELRNAIDEQPQ